MRHGEMAEWSNALDSKSRVPAMVPRVQIPISPPKGTRKSAFWLRSGI